MFPHVDLQRFLFCEPAVTLSAGPGLYPRVRLNMPLQIPLGGKLCITQVAVVRSIPSMSSPVYHEVTLTGKPCLALVMFTLEGFRVLPPVAGQTGRRAEGFIANLALVQSLHAPVWLRDGNFVPCLSGVVGDILQGKALRVRKSRNHLLPRKVKTFAAVSKCGC